jgi:hypothetical protein
MAKVSMKPYRTPQEEQEREELANELVKLGMNKGTGVIAYKYYKKKGSSGWEHWAFVEVNHQFTAFGPIGYQIACGIHIERGRKDLLMKLVKKLLDILKELESEGYSELPPY